MKILIYSQGEDFGDGLLKIPFVRGIKRVYPDAHLTWMTGAHRTLFATVLSDWIKSDVDEVLNQTTYGTQWRHVISHPFHQKFYDLVIDLQDKFLPTLALWRIPHKSFISTNLRGFWSKRSQQVKFTDSKEQLAHLFNLATQTTLSFEWQPKLDPNALAEAQRLLPSGPIYVGLAPFASDSHKAWPLDHFISLAQEILAFNAVPVFLLGPLESHLRQSLNCPGALFPLQESHYSSIDLTVALGQRLNAAVSNDSEISHLLGVGQTPLIMLYGTSPSNLIYPQSKTLHLFKSQDFASAHIEAIPFGAILQTLRPYLDATSRSKTALRR